MANKPTYKELEQKVKALEEEMIARERGEGLNKSERKLQAITENSTIGITLLDTTGQLKEVNPAFLDMLGYSKEELFCMVSPETITHPDDFAVEKKLSRELLEGKRDQFRIEKRYLRKDGQLIWGNLMSFLVKDDQGIPKFCLGMVEDITEKKRVDNELQQRYQTQNIINKILSISLQPHGMVEMLDLILEQITSASWAKLESKGAIFLVEDKPDQLILKSYYNLSEELQTICAKVSFGRCLCGQAALTKKTQFADCLDDRHDNSYKGISPHGHYCVPILSSGRLLGVLNVYLKENRGRVKDEEEFLHAVTNVLAGIIERKQAEEELNEHREHLQEMVQERTSELANANRDLKRVIKELKRAEKALIESQAKWCSLVENAPDIVFTVNHDANITFINHIPAGLSEEQVIGSNVCKYVEPEYRDTVRKSIDQVFQTGEPTCYEVIARGPHDSTSWYSTRLSPIKDEENKVTDTILITRDITDRKQAEEKLKESEERLRAMFEQAAVGVAQILTETGQFLKINQRYCDIVGYTPEEMHGLTLQDITHPDDLQADLENMKKLREGKINEFSMEKRYFRKDGSVVWVNLTVSPMWKIGEWPNYHIAVVEDITVRKHTEEEFLKQQYFLSKAQEIGKIGTWELDIRKNILVWTDENYRIFGLPIGTKLTYETFLDCVHPDDREYVDREWKAAFNKKPYDIEHRLLMSDGSIKWVREKAELEFDEQGNCLKGTGFTQDITERKKATADLERIFNLSAYMVCIASLDGYFKKISPAFEETLGYNQQELLSRSFHDFIHPDDKERTLAVIREKLKRGEQVIGFENRYRCKDGSYKWFAWSARPVVEEGRMFAIAYDITERKQAEEEIKARQREIEEINANLEKRVQEEVEKSRQKDYIVIQKSRLAVMGEMMQYIIHQWGQPLNALNILFYNLEFSLNNIDIGSRQKEVEECIANGLKLVKKMFSTIDDFRSFFKSRKEKVKFNVNKNIKDTLSLFGDSLKYSNVSVKLNETKDLTVNGFPNEFSQVMLNILKNAKDAIFMNNVKGKINIDILSESDFVIVRIRDNGVGIPDSILDKIFDSYFTTKKEDKGTGIGLYMSRVIIEEHMNGHISARNTKQGAELEIKLPMIRS